MTSKEWLEGLQVGDVVAVVKGYSSSEDYQEVPITRTTKTMVVVELPNYLGEPYEMGFRRKDGYQPGDVRYYGKYLVQPSQERRDRKQAKELYNRIKEIFNSTHFLELSIPTLEKIRNTLSDAKQEVAVRMAAKNS